MPYRDRQTHVITEKKQTQGPNGYDTPVFGTITIQNSGCEPLAPALVIKLDPKFSKVHPSAWRKKLSQIIAELVDTAILGTLFAPIFF